MYPTAAQKATETQDTPLSSLFSADFTLGLGTIDHPAAPVRDSISVCATPDW